MVLLLSYFVFSLKLLAAHAAHDHQENESVLLVLFTSSQSRGSTSDWIHIVVCDTALVIGENHEGGGRSDEWQ